MLLRLDLLIPHGQRGQNGVGGASIGFSVDVFLVVGAT
jgi:hypothetical protein